VAVKCPKCHSDNTDTALYCSNCATSLAAAGKQGVSVTRTLEKTCDGLFRGTLFAGRYEIIEELGRGGMGIVYKARDTKLVRTVALKFLPPEWSYDVQAKERFIREARAAAALDHPHICAVHEIDEAEGRMFISMAFVEGESLNRKIERNPLKLEDAVDIGAQVAAGLKEAHLKGIMITEEGQAKILDFGLAKVRGGVMVTREGATMGTIAYMSPEQARGEDVDHRTDIWSLGVVLYQSLTGRMPFPGDHDQVVVHSILQEEPKPLRTLRASIPVTLERIVSRALKKSPDERYQSADEMLVDLLVVKKELEVGSAEEGLSFLRILVKRRVPQILGFYLLGSLGILQLVKWLVNRFLLSPHIPDFSLAALLSFVPTVLLLAYFHGRPGRGKWIKAEKIGISANVMASAVLLVFLFYGKSLGAATTTVTLKNEEGQTVERVIPKSEFLKSFPVFFFDNKSNDPSRNWLQYAIPFLLNIDLTQDLFVQAQSGYFFYNKMKSAGFPEGVGLPLTLKSKIARELHTKYFVSGSFSIEGEEVFLETSIYETRRASVVTKRDLKGQDIFKLVDETSLTVRRDLGIPEQHIKDTKDLPVAEIATPSVQALKSYIDGANAMIFEKNWDEGLKEIERSVIEDPTFAYAYYDMQSLYVFLNQGQKREQAFKSLMQYLYKLPERVQFLIKSDYYAFKEDAEKRLAVVKMMIELNPDDIAGHQALAIIYSQTNKKEEALAEFHRILELDPEKQDALLWIGSYYKEKGMFKEALEYYERYARRYPDDVTSYTVIGGLYRTLGDFERAKSYYNKALLLEPEKISVLLTLAKIESTLGNYERSEGMYLDVLKISKNPEERMGVYDALASVYETQGQYRKSLEYVHLYLEEGEKIQPPFFSLVNKIEFLDKYVLAGQKDEAFKIIEDFKSQAAPPFDRMVPLVYFGYYVEIEDPDKAANLLKEVEVSMQSPLFESIRADIIELQGRFHEMKGEYEQAIAAYKKSLESRPTYPDTNVLIGRTYRKLRDFKKAEEYLKKNLITSPFDPELHYEISLLYIDMKSNAKGEEHLNIALNIWKNADLGIPKVEDAKKKLAELENQ
jgi:serine/threonine protein kinase/tetratricopeptide (TPR) repeat protein